MDRDPDGEGNLKGESFTVVVELDEFDFSGLAGINGDNSNQSVGDTRQLGRYFIKR